jgi:hypothetical protein
MSRNFGSGRRRQATGTVIPALRHWGPRRERTEIEIEIEIEIRALKSSEARISRHMRRIHDHEDFFSDEGFSSNKCKSLREK